MWVVSYNGFIGSYSSYWEAYEVAKACSGLESPDDMIVYQQLGEDV